MRITFSDNSRTLTKEEVAAVTDGIIADLEQQGIMLKKRSGYKGRSWAPPDFFGDYITLPY